MSKTFVNETEIIKQLKLSCQLPSVIWEIAKRKIIEETAQAKRISLAEEELQQAADGFRLQNNLLSSQATFDWLERHSLSTEDFEELIYSNALAAKLARYLFGDRAESHFYEHQYIYTKAVIYEIILAEFNLAMELFYGIQEGEFSFWDVAHQHTQNEELRRCGGYRGILQRHQLKPEISAAVFAAKPPQVLKPIIVAKQTYLVFVEKILQPKLDKSLRRQIVSELFEQWLDKQLHDSSLVRSNRD